MRFGRQKLGDRFDVLPLVSFPTAYGDFIWNRTDAETRAAVIATFIIEVVLCTKGILFAGGEQKLKRAKKDGKFVLGTLKDSWYKEREPEKKTANRLYTGIFIPVLVAFTVMTALGFRP